jgi:hypothetical protein
MFAIETFVRNIFGVWTGTVPMEEHAIGALIVFLPWVLLAHVGYAATEVKELEKLRNFIAAAGILVALGPVAIPAVLLFLFWRWMFPPPKKKSPPSAPQA